MEAMRELNRQERLIRVFREKQYRAEGHTEEEAEWLARHTNERSFSDLSPKEQKRLNKELDQMFATIPEEYRERARELSGM